MDLRSYLNISSFSGGNVFPSVPTREKVCSVSITFQGLIVTTKQFGTLPWFEPAYQCLDSLEDRMSVIQAKKNTGFDTHQILEFFSYEGSIYDEGGQPYQHVNTFNCEHDQPRFLALVEEVILNGLTPIVVFDGDDGDNPMGYPNALRQLPILVSLLKSSKYADLTKYVLFGRLWDGVFYGSSPEHIQNFGKEFRKLVPDGFLAIEHNSGHIPVGNGPGDYIPPNGMMVDYDVIMSEFDYSNSVPPNNTIWQVAARFLGPKYNRPPDQPSDDDPPPAPWYLKTGNARGPYYACAFEWEGIYYFVRSQSTSEQEAQRRKYMHDLGYGKLTG